MNGLIANLKSRVIGEHPMLNQVDDNDVELMDQDEYNELERCMQQALAAAATRRQGEGVGTSSASVPQLFKVDTGRGSPDAIAIKTNQVCTPTLIAAACASESVPTASPAPCNRPGDGGARALLFEARGLHDTVAVLPASGQTGYDYDKYRAPVQGSACSRLQTTFPVERDLSRDAAVGGQPGTNREQGEQEVSDQQPLKKEQGSRRKLPSSFSTLSSGCHAKWSSRRTSQAPAAGAQGAGNSGSSIAVLSSRWPPPAGSGAAGTSAPAAWQLPAGPWQAAASAPAAHSFGEHGTSTAPCGVKQGLPDTSNGFAANPSALRPVAGTTPAAHATASARPLLAITMPCLVYLGKVRYVSTEDELLEALRQLQEAQPSILGMDIEWTPTFILGQKPRKTALLQLCYCCHSVESRGGASGLQVTQPTAGSSTSSGVFASGPCAERRSTQTTDFSGPQPCTTRSVPWQNSCMPPRPGSGPPSSRQCNMPGYSNDRSCQAAAIPCSGLDSGRLDARQAAEHTCSSSSANATSRPQLTGGVSQNGCPDQGHDSSLQVPLCGVRAEEAPYVPAPPLDLHQATGTNCVCLLLHIAHTGMPTALVQMLESNTIRKAGVNISGDAIKLKTDFGMTMGGLVELSTMGNERQLAHVEMVTTHEDSKRWSLAGLVETLLRRTLPKPNNLRLGDWDKRPLEANQQRYAALDAFASLATYCALAALPERQGLKAPKARGTK